MYEYKFVRLRCTSEKGFLEPLEHQPEEDYREIVREHAIEGWRLVQIFSLINTRYSGADDIVFHPTTS
jgi:hypothetical protein